MRNKNNISFSLSSISLLRTPDCWCWCHRRELTESRKRRSEVLLEAHRASTLTTVEEQGLGASGAAEATTMVGATSWRTRCVASSPAPPPLLALNAGCPLHHRRTHDRAMAHGTHVQVEVSQFHAHGFNLAREELDSRYGTPIPTTVSCVLWRVVFIFFIKAWVPS